MYNSTEEYLIREALYGDKSQMKKNEIIKLMEYYKESIPKSIKLNKDGTPDMRFKKNLEWYFDSLHKQAKKCKEKNAQDTYQVKV
jgi:hypothetical protein